MMKFFVFTRTTNHKMPRQIDVDFMCESIFITIRLISIVNLVASTHRKLI